MTAKIALPLGMSKARELTQGVACSHMDMYDSGWYYDWCERNGSWDELYDNLQKHLDEQNATVRLD